jgi:hypothetical protein
MSRVDSVDEFVDHILRLILEPRVRCDDRGVAQFAPRGRRVVEAAFEASAQTEGTTEHVRIAIDSGWGVDRE